MGKRSSITDEIDNKQEASSKAFGPLDKMTLLLSQKAKEQIDLAFAKAVIASMKPYSLFESEE